MILTLGTEVLVGNEFYVHLNAPEGLGRTGVEVSVARVGVPNVQTEKIPPLEVMDEVRANARAIVEAVNGRQPTMDLAAHVLAANPVEATVEHAKTLLAQPVLSWGTDPEPPEGWDKYDENREDTMEQLGEMVPALLERIAELERALGFVARGELPTP